MLGPPQEKESKEKSDSKDSKRLARCGRCVNCKAQVPKLPTAGPQARTFALSARGAAAWTQAPEARGARLDGGASRARVSLRTLRAPAWPPRASDPLLMPRHPP